MLIVHNWCAQWYAHTWAVFTVDCWFRFMLCQRLWIDSNNFDEQCPHCYSLKLMLVNLQINILLPSMLWHCWLGVRIVSDIAIFVLKGDVKLQITWVSWWATGPWKIDLWVAGVVVCLDWGVNDLHMVKLMTSSLGSLKSRMVYLSGAGLPRFPGKKAVKWVLLSWSWYAYAAC